MRALFRTAGKPSTHARAARFFATPKFPLNRVISFHFTFKDTKTGQVLQSSGDHPFSFLEGAEEILPGVAAKIKDLSPGESCSFHVPAKDAWGERKEENVIRCTIEGKNRFKVGDRVTLGGDELQNYPVKEVTPTELILDSNHPYAGVSFDADVTLVSYREATPLELQHGYAHQPGQQQDYIHEKDNLYQP